MEHATPTTLAQATLPGANRALLLATLAFAACFSTFGTRRTQPLRG